MARYGSLAVFLLMVITASAISSIFSAGEWYYDKLNKPVLWPPVWLTVMVWALVYLMGQRPYIPNRGIALVGFSAVAEYLLVFSVFRNSPNWLGLVAAGRNLNRGHPEFQGVSIDFSPGR